MSTNESSHIPFENISKRIESLQKNGTIRMMLNRIGIKDDDFSSKEKLTM